MLDGFNRLFTAFIVLCAALIGIGVWQTWPTDAATIPAAPAPSMLDGDVQPPAAPAEETMLPVYFHCLERAPQDGEPAQAREDGSTYGTRLDADDAECTFMRVELQDTEQMDPLCCPYKRCLWAFVVRDDGAVEEIDMGWPTCPPPSPS